MENPIQLTASVFWEPFKLFILPRAAKMLNCDIEDLYVIDQTSFGYRYMYTRYRDNPVKDEAEGVVEDCPIVHLSRAHGAQPTIGYGLTLYSAHGNKELKYVRYHNKRQSTTWDENETYYILKKGTIFRLKRHMARMMQKVSSTNEPPILAPGILEDVINSTVGFIRNQKIMKKYKVKINRGILLDGSPGNGKTMLCRYLERLCNDFRITFGTVSSSEIDEAYKKNSLSTLMSSYQVTIFDDIDIGYLNRRSGDGKMACSLLTAMDGMSKNSDFLVRIFTTNEHIDALDEAFTRPGRIDRCIRLNKPNRSLRYQLIQKWPEEILSAINSEELATRSRGFSFADLEAIKCFLVSEFLFGCKTWNIDKALGVFNERKRERNGMGFASEVKQEEVKTVEPTKEPVAA